MFFNDTGSARGKKANEPENGTPRSRARANSCLEAVARLLMALQIIIAVIMQVIRVAAAREPVVV